MPEFVASRRETSKPRGRAAIVAAVTGLVALASWKNNSEIVRTFSNVRPDSSWLQWAYRWPGSFFEASPFFDKLTDASLAAGTTALAFSVTMRREGVRQTLRKAVTGQFLGSAATRLTAVSGIIPSSHMPSIDVGSSSVAVALGANYLSQRIQEERSPGDVIACKAVLGVGAIGLAAAAFVDPSMTDLVSHATGFTYGYFEGRRTPAQLIELPHSTDISYS